MPSRLRNSVAIAFVCLLQGCATFNPATGRKEIIFIDTGQEVALGRSIDQSLHKEIKITTDPVMQRRLDRIGQRVAAVSDRRDVQYTFRVVDDATLNAFAIPGGFVYVNRGVMERATDDELAGVIAHEIGHVAARHSVKRLQAAMGYQMLMSIVAGRTGTAALLNQSIDVIFNAVNLGYSRQDELLSDRLAVRYSARAGYNPRGVATFFMKLKGDSDKTGPHFSLPFLSSHPPIDDRIRRVQAEIDQYPYGEPH